MSQLVTKREALAELGIGHATFYVLKRCHPNIFPKPVKVEGQKFIYELDELRAFIAFVSPHLLKTEVSV